MDGEKISEKSLVIYLADLFVESMIARSYQIYCTEFLKSGASYYHDCKTYNREMNSMVAVNLLTNIRKHLRQYKLMQKSLGSINDERIAILTDAEILVSNYLRDKFRIKEIVEIDTGFPIIPPSVNQNNKQNNKQNDTIVDKSVKKRKKDDDDDYEGYYGAIVF